MGRSRSRSHARTSSSHPAQTSEPSQPTLASPKSASAKTLWIDILIVFALALAVRLLTVYYNHSYDPFFGWSRKGFDMNVYQDQAQQILAGDLLLSKIKIFFFSPLFSYFCAGVYALFGIKNFVALHVVQAAMGAWAVALLYVTARTWLTRWASLLAAALLGLAAPWLFYEQSLLHEGIMFFCYSVFLWGVRTAQVGWASPLDELDQTPQTPEAAYGLRWRWPRLRLAAAGLAAAVALTGRGNILAVMMATLIWMLWAIRRPGRLGQIHRWGWGAVLCFLFGFALLAGPLIARNHHTSGRWTLGLGNGGLMLYMGNAIDAQGTFSYSPRYLEAREKDQKNPGQRIFRTYLLEDIKASPGHFLKLQALKTYYFFRSTDLPDNLNFQLGRRLLGPVHWTAVQWEWLCPLGLVGLGLCCGQWRRWSLLLLFTASFCASIIIVIPVGRYRAPILLVFALSAALAIEMIVQAIRQKRWSLPAATLATTAVLIAVLWGPSYVRFNDYTNATIAARDSGLFTQTQRLIEWGQLDFIEQAEQAEQEKDMQKLNFALGSLTQIKPWPPAIVHRLAGILLRQGQPAQAIDLLRGALKAYPDDQTLKQMLAQVEQIYASGKE